jgi:2-keto-4-pentenoate hydratase
MFMAIDLATVVEDFWVARKHGEFFPRAYYDRLTSDDAYRIQLALIDRRLAAGERQIGWKVGLTSKAIQDQYRSRSIPAKSPIGGTQPTCRGGRLMSVSGGGTEVARMRPEVSV